MNFGGARMIISELPDNVGCNVNDTESIFYRIKQLYSETDVDLARFVVTNKTFTFTKDTFSKLELAKALQISGTSIGDKISEKIADEAIKGLSFYVISGDNGHYIEEVRDIKDGENYTGIAIYDCETQKAVIYILEKDATTDTTVKADGDGLELGSWIYDNKADAKKIESTLKFDFDYTYTSTKNGNGDETKSNYKLGTAKLYFDTLAEDHGDIAIGGYLFGLDRDHDRSFFSYNDTIVRVDDNGTVREYPYTQDGIITLEAVKCDDCDLVTAAVIDLSNAKVEAGKSTWVRIVINGKNNENGNVTGNKVEISVEFTLNAKGEVVATLHDNFMNDVVGGNLNHVDLTKIYG